MADPKKKPVIPINNPDAGKIKVIVTGLTQVKSTDPRVVVERRS